MSETALTKEDVFKKIAQAVQMDTLGFFIGSGFTKALLEYNGREQSYDWKELLVKACTKLNVPTTIFSKGLTYPQVASEICSIYANDNNKSSEKAISKLKRTIAELVDVRPEENILDEYKSIFKTIEANWIVTTNYDTLIEQILCEKALSINPNDGYYKTKDFTPIYHIHGSKLDADSIVITNEDYTHTLRFSDYRHARLPFLIKESTVLMIGYSLNDLNVLSAVDYCQNVYKNVSPAYDAPIIQLLYERSPKEEPYCKNEIIVQEISDLALYLKELSNYVNRYKSIIGKEKKRVQELIEQYTTADGTYIDRIIENKEERKQMIERIYNLDRAFWYAYPSFIAFIKNALNKLWDIAIRPNQFHSYADILDFLMDLIVLTKNRSVPNNYIDFLIDEFIDIAGYVGDDPGQSWPANNLWNKRKIEIPKEFVDAAISRCQRNDYKSIVASELLEQYNHNSPSFRGDNY